MHVRGHASRQRVNRQRGPSPEGPSGHRMTHMARAGEPLPAGVRSSLEPRFGHSFEQVRVHADPSVPAMLQPLGVEAATVGGEILVNPGRYAPDTAAGRYLLAHELAHVVQGWSHGLDRSVAVSRPGHDSEREAGAAADAAVAGMDVPALNAAAAPVAPFFSFAATPLMGGPPYEDRPGPVGPGGPLGWPAPNIMMGLGQPMLPARTTGGAGARTGAAEPSGPIGSLASGVVDAGKGLWDFLTGW